MWQVLPSVGDKKTAKFRNWVVLRLSSEHTKYANSWKTCLVDQHCGNGCSVNRAPPLWRLSRGVVLSQSTFRLVSSMLRSHSRMRVWPKHTSSSEAYFEATGRNTTGPPSRELRCICECYRRRQTTTDTATVTSLPPTLCVGGPAISRTVITVGHKLVV